MSVADVGMEVLMAGNNNGNVTASITADDFASVVTIEGTLRGQSIIKGEKSKGRRRRRRTEIDGVSSAPARKKSFPYFV